MSWIYSRIECVWGTYLICSISNSHFYFYKQIVLSCTDKSAQNLMEL